MGNEASRVGNQASFLEDDAGSSPTGRTPSADDEPEEEEEQIKIPSKLSDTMVVLLNLLRSGKLEDPDLLFIIAEFVGLTGVMVHSRVDKRGGNQEHENRLDLLSSLYKERMNEEDTLKSLHVIANFNIQKVDYRATAKDQGWSSYRQDYGKRNSSTWGEAQVQIKRLANPSKLRDGRVEEALPRYNIYRNIHAGKEFEDHEYSFEHNTAFVRCLGAAIEQVRQQRAADVASLLHSHSTDECVNEARTSETILEISCQLWCRSQYPAWRHYVLRSQISTHWKMRKEAFLGQINHYSGSQQKEQKEESELAPV